MPPTITVLPNGPKIREVRELAGYTQKAFAERTRRDPKTVWVVEHRRERVSLALIRQFAGALSRDPDEARKLLEEFILPDEAAGEDDAEDEPDGVAA